MTKPTVSEVWQRSLAKPWALAPWLVVVIVFVWFYWSSMNHLLNTWWTQDDYGHGFTVPIVAVVLLWLRRDMIASHSGGGSWWGLPVLALWAFIYWASVHFNYGSPREYSMLVFFAGVAIFVGGWQALNWSWPSIVVLLFMIPLPGALQGAFSLWLQGIATRMSVFTIQTLGLAAIADGHVINLSHQQLEVEKACSGLRMMMLSFYICVVAAFVVRKPLWEKLVLIASAAPIAVVSNVARIVTVALLCEFFPSCPSWLVSLLDVKHPQEVYDKLVGMFLMMPLGLLLLWAEMALLSKLLLAPLPERPLMIGKVSNKS